MSTLLSGGCHGADLAFDEQAKLAGHKIKHFSFPGHHIRCDNVVQLNIMEMLEADEHLALANKTLDRKIPKTKEYVTNLLRRNWFQIKTTERVYAAAPIKGRQVIGGTGWAIQMAIDIGIKEIWVFDLDTLIWHNWTTFLGWVGFPDRKPPKPHGTYTGIGSRELSDNGYQAIVDLYAE